MHGCRCGTVFDNNVLGHHRDEAVGVMGIESRHHTWNEAVHKDLIDRCRFDLTSCYRHQAIEVASQERCKSSDVDSAHLRL